MSAPATSPRRPPRTYVQGGELRGRRLQVAPGVRPTESRVRGAVFSIWVDLVPGSRFLDLFAGSGAVGLEALSRGAASVVFVEGDARALAALHGNLDAVGGGGGRIRVVRGRLPETLSPRRLGAERFDLVYADPPYGFDGYGALVAAALPLVAPGGELAVESAADHELPADVPGGHRIDERVYGACRVSFYQPATRDGDIG